MQCGNHIIDQVLAARERVDVLVHHMAAHGDERAEIARETLAKFGINVDDA